MPTADSVAQSQIAFDGDDSRFSAEGLSAFNAAVEEYRADLVVASELVRKTGPAHVFTPPIIDQAERFLRGHPSKHKRHLEQISRLLYGASSTVMVEVLVFFILLLRSDNSSWRQNALTVVIGFGLGLILAVGGVVCRMWGQRKQVV